MDPVLKIHYFSQWFWKNLKQNPKTIPIILENKNCLFLRISFNIRL
jgi:hypothetical protein